MWRWCGGVRIADDGDDGDFDDSDGEGDSTGGGEDNDKERRRDEDEDALLVWSMFFVCSHAATTSKA